ncbi:MAG: FtsW/RodA/SpoVE family cell cycle protein [Oscillospiraceae bacterium]|nr:FtsW/RodA/SpoVE family cell cycle protein [Oscillospiraceae bacterium]
MVETLMFFVRLLLPFFSIIIVYTTFKSLKNNQRIKTPLISLKNKTAKKQIPVMFWENSIGRSRSSDIVLNDPTVSRDHAVLFRREKGWIISDTNSKSGVYVNEEKIKKPTQIYIDDILTLGSNSLIVKKKDSLNFDDGFDILSSSEITSNKRHINQFLLLLIINFFHFLISLETYFTHIREVKKEKSNFEFKDIFDLDKMFNCLVPFLIILMISWVFFFITKIVFKRKNFELEAIGIFLSGTGILILASQNKVEVIQIQIVSLIIGIVLFCSLIKIIKNLEKISKLRLLITIFATLFFILNLLIAKEHNGSKNWIFIGPISIQPSEFIKVAFVFSGASTLDKLQTTKNLSGFILFSAFCICCLFFMKDFGTACVFFVAFLICSFMRSGSIRTIILSCSAALIGMFLILKFKPYIAERFSVWQHVFENSQGVGYQQSRALTYLASGGLIGVGSGNGKLRYIFAGTSDLMFSTISEELGLIVGISVTFSIALIALFSRSYSERCRSTFYSIASCTAGGILVFQSCLHVFGSTDVLPLTGVTLPFLSLGGSSLVSVWGLLAFIKASDDRTYSLK